MPSKKKKNKASTVLDLGSICHVIAIHTLGTWKKKESDDIAITITEKRTEQPLVPLTLTHFLIEVLGSRT